MNKLDSDIVIDVNKIDEVLGKINLIDIREPYEYEEGTINSAKNIPMNELMENHDKYLNKNEKFYILCRSGVRSARTCAYLRRWGYDVIDVTGGVINYKGKEKS